MPTWLNLMSVVSLALLTACASVDKWLDDLEEKTSFGAPKKAVRENDSRALESRPAVVAAAPPTPPLITTPPPPPPLTWSLTIPGGPVVRFGVADAFSGIEAFHEQRLSVELCKAGWAREYYAAPYIYYVEIDNRKGTKRIPWSHRDYIVVAADGKTFEQDRSFLYAPIIKRSGGYERSVMPGTAAIMPVVFSSALPMSSLSGVWIQAGSRVLPLAIDKKVENSAQALPASPAR